MKAKRTPLLADRFLARKHEKSDFVEDKVYRRVQGLLLEAKRFVLDSLAAHYVGDFIRKVPEAIAYAQEFAIPPFEKTYIEVPIRELWSAVNYGMQPDEDADTRVGYLIVGPRCYVLTEGYKGAGARGLEAGLMPILYRLHQPNVEFDNAIAKESHLSEGHLTMAADVSFNANRALEGVDVFYWGTSYHSLPARCLPALRAEHSMEMIGDDRFRDFKLLGSVLRGSQGDLRNIIALLLFLNQTSKLRVEGEVPHQQGMVGNKAATLVKHHVITLRVDPVPHLKKYYGEPAAQGAWRRAHDVRGHFCHDKTAREHCSSMHDWREYGVNQWRCLKCGGLRWWKKPHRRGHKEKGRVESSYNVISQHARVGKTQRKEIP